MGLIVFMNPTKIEVSPVQGFWCTQPFFFFFFFCTGVLCTYQVYRWIWSHFHFLLSLCRDGIISRALNFITGIEDSGISLFNFMNIHDAFWILDSSNLVTIYREPLLPRLNTRKLKHFQPFIHLWYLNLLAFSNRTKSLRIAFCPMVLKRCSLHPMPTFILLRIKMICCVLLWRSCFQNIYHISVFWVSNYTYTHTKLS